MAFEKFGEVKADPLSDMLVLCAKVVNVRYETTVAMGSGALSVESLNSMYCLG